MLFWGGGWEDRKDNSRFKNNKTDWYNITYRGKKCCSYRQIWVRGDFLEAAGRNYICVSGGLVVRRDIRISGGGRCHRISLVRGRGGMQSYKSTRMPKPGGRRGVIKGKLAQVVRK